MNTNGGMLDEEWDRFMLEFSRMDEPQLKMMRVLVGIKVADDLLRKIRTIRESKALFLNLTNRINSLHCEPEVVIDLDTLLQGVCCENKIDK